MTISVDGHGLTLDDVGQAAFGGAPCRLDDKARVRMQNGRDLVDRLADEPRAIYGINTGFGPLSGTRISGADLAQHQVNLFHHLSVGQGGLFDEAETRAIMLARANALARGYSGIRPEVVDNLITLLNAGVLPEIPLEGSVGASGDLVPLAHMGRVLIGLGHARYQGERLEANEALKKAGLKPVVLKCKEGLSLVNGTSVMTGVAALSCLEAGASLSWMELFSACLMQVMDCAPEVLCEQLHRARGHRGQHLVAARISSHLRTHPAFAKEIDEHNWGSQGKSLEKGVEIQDAYSVRCTPQILGAFQDAFWHIEQVVAREINASTDNPLIFPGSQTVIHGGNFYGQHVSMVSDYQRLCLAKMALLADRQVDRMLNWHFSQGLPPLLTGAAPGLNTGMGGCQLMATSLAAECRLLAAPASVQTIPTNGNNQDVVSMGCTAAKLTRQMLPKIWTLLAVEAMALVQAADLRGKDGVMGGDYKTLHEVVRSVSPMLKEDRPLGEEITKVAKLLRDPAVQSRLLPKRPLNPVRIEVIEEAM